MTSFEKFNRVGLTRHGDLIYNKNDIYIGHSIELYGEYSERETAVFDQIVEPGHIVLDVGANIGVHTLFLAQKVGPAGRVLAFEPQRVVFQTLCGNMALNSITNAHCFHVALGAEAGETIVPEIDYCQSGNFGGVELPGGQTGESTPVVTIDSFNLSRCDVIKIDVEGMEQDVLTGAQETIRRLRPILYVECDRSDRQNALIRCINSLGYLLYWHRPELFNHDNFRSNPDNVFQEIVSQNLLCFDKAADTQLTGFTQVELPEAA